MSEEEKVQEQTVEQAPAADIEEDAHLGPTGVDMGAIYDVPVDVSAILGHASLHVSQLLKLGRGAIIELDRKVGEAIDIYVNNRLVARGEIVVMDDNQIGVTMTEIIRSDSV